MNLNNEQINKYHENGFLVIDEFFDKSVTTNLKRRISQFESCKNLPNVICEDGEIRSIFAPHEIDKAFLEIYKNQSLLSACASLLNEKIYLYQYKINLKKPFVGKWWEWHQDFPYWRLDDGVDNPNMISVMIYLDDTKLFQGPLMVIPGSHKTGIENFEEKGLVGDDLIQSLGSNLKYSIDKEVVKKCADRSGINVLEHKAGSAIFFHPNVFHASVGNLSPYTRDTLIITYNAISNIPREESKRPYFLCSRDFTTLI